MTNPLPSFEPGAQGAEGTIPLSVPEIRGREWEYVKDCLDTGWISSVGEYVTRFENEIARRTGTRFAVATVTGTAALHIALMAAGVRPDDEVLVPTLTFIAPANAIRYAGAWPVFIDAEPQYWQMDPAKVAEFLATKCARVGGELRNKSTGRRVSAIVPVDILGHPVDIDPIAEIARKYGLAVVEDATESLGGKYKERFVGQLGDIACFSFNGNKVLTCGGGGMIVTDNEAWAKRAKYLTTQAKDDPIEYVHGEIGYNYRLTNLQAAVGCAQLEQLDEYVAKKRAVAADYRAAFKDVPGITCMDQAPWASSIFWLFTILVDEARFGRSSRSLMRYLAEQGIQARPLWQPLHLSPPYRSAEALLSGVAERLNRDALSLPSSVGLTRKDFERVVDAVRAARGTPR